MHPLRWPHRALAATPLILALLAAHFGGAAPSRAQSRTDLVDAGPGWQLVGDFDGSPGAGLLRLIHEQIRERENDGALYQDLGDISLGLGLDLGDDGRINWDNSFYRRVLPFHAELAPGEPLGPEDLSRYVDVKTIVSRGRLTYDYLPDLVGDTGVGLRVEGGTSLTLAHVVDPLPLDDRPLDDVLEEERSTSISDLLQEDNAARATRSGDSSLIRLGTEGVAALAQWIADMVGDHSVDTERGAIFFEGYSDPITQIIDLGVPVDSELFRADGPLGVGDRVRHVTFIGLVPVGAALRKYGLTVSYQRFYRYLRETTILKSQDDEVIVVVRNSVATGNEYIPLKVRPEVRVLGILKLGYTFFEQIYDRAKTASWTTAYRVDLTDPRGLAAFELLLQEGAKVSFRPLASTAEKGDGAEVLHTEVKRGRQNTAMMRAQLFSLLNKRDSRIASDQVVSTGDLTIEQVARTKSTTYRKSLGRDRRWHKLFAVTAQGDVTVKGDVTVQPDPADDPAPEPAATHESWSGAVTLVSGLRDDFADATTVERAAGALQSANPAVDWSGLVEELSNVDPDDETRLVVNSLLSLNGAHMARLSSIDEDRLWLELGDLLLGPEHRETWATTERRAAWRKHPRKEAAAHGADLPPTSLVVTSTKSSPKKLGARKRFRFARRVAKRFTALQRTIRREDCLRCVARAFDEWRDVAAMHALFARLSVDPALPEPGYHYEVFTDSMLRPATLTNGIRYSFPTDWDATADLLKTDASPRIGISDDPSDVETLQSELDKQRWDWLGSRSLIDASESRLDAGMLLANVGGGNVGGENVDGEPEEPCWKLRLFSDQEFDPSLRLRVDLREASRGTGADRTIGVGFFPLGTPTAVIQTPFIVARYFFDIEIPSASSVQEGKHYTLLLRVLNPDGYPVSEEQQLAFVAPTGVTHRMPQRCFAASAEPTFVDPEP